MVGRMLDFFRNLFDTSDFPARWHCGNWSRELGWTYITSDLLVFGAYFAIPISLAVYVRRKNQEIAFPRVYWLFASFILSCGITHLIDASIFWQPWYRLSALTKAVTAVASWATFVALLKIMPQALALPGTLRLNADLKREIEIRKKSEAALQDSAARLNSAMQERERLHASESKARSEAEQANAMKDQFLATLSHELRTPLGAILNWCHLLKDEAVSEDDLKHGLETIERNSRAQLQLVEDLLDMSRIVSGKVRLDVQAVDLHSVVTSAISAHRPAANQKQIQLTSVLDPSVAKIRGDAARLEQIVSNLLANAVKFTPEGGHIHVALERVNSHVEITVSDDGIGIAPEFLPYAFERFAQGDAMKNRRYGGLGLGLSIVKNLVALHGGSVWAKSAGIGKGSTFRVQLPCPVSTHHASEEDSRVHPSASSGGQDTALARLDGLNILLVDDDPDALETVGRILASAGASRSLASSAAAALQLMEKTSFDVLASDIGMPVMDGLEFIAEVRRREGPSRNIPALAVSAFARSNERRRALEAGFDGYLSKPIEPSEFLALVKRMATRTSKSN